MLSLHDVTIRSGGFRLSGIELHALPGECLALVGPSGIGKTTLLEAICGLREIEGGSITLAGRNITGLPPGARGIGLVPQDIALFPNLSVHEQLAFGPSVHGWPRPRIQERVHSLAESLDLVPLLGRRSTSLSGGEARRVALGRALALEPKLLCLDEAFTGLHAELHTEILELVNGIIHREQLTTLVVTHSMSEAHTLAGRIVPLDTLINPLSPLSAPLNSAPKLPTPKANS